MHNLQLNEVSKPLRSQSGYHLIQMLDRRQNDISLDIAGNRARQAIFRRKAAEFYDNWYGTLRDAAFIEYVAVNPG
jgi:peptidyl-prolyl cis-trans isomerase SurA